jgi:hypothetical protein
MEPVSKSAKKQPDQTFSPQRDPLSAVLTEITSMKVSDRINLIAAHGLLELLVNAVVEASCKHGKDISSHRRDYTHSAKLVILHELGILADWEFEQFTWFRKLRNRAAHEPLFLIHPDDLTLFRGTEHSTPSAFHELCVDLVAGFWNRHVELFGPKFMPDVWAASQQI